MSRLAEGGNQGIIRPKKSGMTLRHVSGNVKEEAEHMKVKETDLYQS